MTSSLAKIEDFPSDPVEFLRRSFRKLPRDIPMDSYRK